MTPDGMQRGAAGRKYQLTDEDRMAACICWSFFAEGHDGDPYTYWKAVAPVMKEEYRVMARAALNADPRRERARERA